MVENVLLPFLVKVVEMDYYTSTQRIIQGPFIKNCQVKQYVTGLKHKLVV